jgi:hypothetical protein
MTSVGGRHDEQGTIYSWTERTEPDTVWLLEENDQMKAQIYSLRMNLNRISSELDTEKSLRTMADQQLRHALSLLRDSVRNSLPLSKRCAVFC